MLTARLLVLLAACALFSVPHATAKPAASAGSDFCQTTDTRPQSDIVAIRRSMDAATWSEEKVNLMVWGVGNGTAPIAPLQLVYLLNGLTFSSDLTDALVAITPWLTGFTPDDMVKMLGAFSFSSDKMSALKNCKDFFREDLFEQRFNCCSAFTFSSDQEACRAVLNTSSPFSCTWGHITAKRFNVVVDVSGSMSTPFTWDNKAYTRLSFVVGDLDMVVRTQLKTEQYFNLFSFSDSVTAWQPGLVDANNANIDSAVSFLSGLRANGCTNTYGALQRAFQDQDLKAVYFLSDGEPSCGTTSNTASIIQAAVQWSKAAGNIPIHTVAMTAGTDSGGPAARAFMKALAQATGGSYRGFA